MRRFRGIGWIAGLLAAVLALPVTAETLVAARTLRAATLIAPEDVLLTPGVTPGALSDPADAVGMEARIALYAGRPIRPGDLGPPALVERNGVVRLVFARGGLAIVTDGRALARGGLGDTIRVMNLASRTTVSGVIAADGSVHVAGSRPAAAFP